MPTQWTVAMLGKAVREEWGKLDLISIKQSIDSVHERIHRHKQNKDLRDYYTR